MRLAKAIKALHTRKNSAYGAAWKRRGEHISALPNIARKVDRLEVFASQGVELSDESVLDTAIDLFVYVTKYRLLLADSDPNIAVTLLKPMAPTPPSDHDQNFNDLVDQSGVGTAAPGDVCEDIDRIVRLFERLWPAAEAGEREAAKLMIANDLSSSVERLIAGLARDAPQAVDRFVQEELQRET